VKHLEQYLARLEEFLECTIEHLEGEHKGKVVIRLDVFNALYDAAHDIAAPLLREEIAGNSKTVPCEPNEESADRLFLWNIGHYGGSAYDTYKAAIQAAPSRLQELVEGE
jgi:hypothetical protein